MKKYLCYFEIHTKTRTTYIHTIVKTESELKAFEIMNFAIEVYKNEGITLQAKGVIEYKSLSDLEKYLAIKEVL